MPEPELQVENHPEAEIVVDPAAQMLLEEAAHRLPAEDSLRRQAALPDRPQHQMAEVAANPERQGKPESLLLPVEEIPGKIPLPQLPGDVLDAALLHFQSGRDAHGIL